jgi:soluble lytic murein transglycosylase-like protein
VQAAVAVLMAVVAVSSAVAATPGDAVASAHRTASTTPSTPPAGAQNEPALESLLKGIIQQGDCFVDGYESRDWHRAMESRLARFVPTHEARIEILDSVYCEAKRDPSLKLRPDLVLALIEVESRFNPWAVSPTGAVGLMQVMPFWPRQLGMQNELAHITQNIRVGCEILRYYLRAEHHDWSRALARYNGSAGRDAYAALIMQRWQQDWRY